MSLEIVFRYHPKHQPIYGSVYSYVRKGTQFFVSMAVFMGMLSALGMIYFDELSQVEFVGLNFMVFVYWYLKYYTPVNITSALILFLSSNAVLTCLLVYVGRI